MMKLHEIFTHEDPIVLELVKKRLAAGDVVILLWDEYGKQHEADVNDIRPAKSGDGYAIDYSYSDHDGNATYVADTIFFRERELEKAKFSRNSTAMWTLDLRKDKDAGQ
jgi:hypothetical protein